MPTNALVKLTLKIYHFNYMILNDVIYEPFGEKDEPDTWGEPAPW